MKKTALVRWTGDLKTGNGIVTTESRSLNSALFSAKTRFEDKPGTNPEELIAAAHASCFSMALAAELEKENLKADYIETTARAHIEKVQNEWSINQVELDVSARVPGVDQRQFQQACEITKINCPVSRLLKADILLTTHLVPQAHVA